MTTLEPSLELFGRLMALDRRGAFALVEDYLAERPDVADFYADVLEPALLHAGREWEQGRISVAHEHYISEAARELVRRYGPRIWSEDPGPSPVAVACGAPRERHSIGLMMVVDALRAGGLEVHMLGEGLPAEAVIGLLEQTDARLLCLSCALSIHLPGMDELISRTRRSRPGLRVAVGGAALRHRGEELRSRLGADWTAPDVRAVRRMLPSWLPMLAPAPPLPPGP